jgi:hypothetical protein
MQSESLSCRRFELAAHQSPSISGRPLCEVTFTFASAVQLGGFRVHTRGPSSGCECTIPSIVEGAWP